jgi:putative ABC transport system permease protein
MLKNYLKIVWRNLKRRPTISIINIGGLAIGLAVFIVIMLYVWHEYSYDNFFSQSNQIYRVVMVNKSSNFHPVNVNVPEPIAGQLKQLFPMVKQSVRVAGPFGSKLLSGSKGKIYSKKFAAVGASYFKLFDFTFIRGNAQTALNKPHSIVLTRELAKKLFGNENAMGKPVTVNNKSKYTVRGIIKNLPSNTHFKIAAFVKRPVNKNMNLWNYATNQTYVKLAQPHQAAHLQSLLPAYVENHKHYPKGMTKQTPKLVLQPIATIHLHPQSRQVPSSRPFYIKLLIIVAALILLVACMNYMNIATARSAMRAREVGIRKSVGAHRGQIIGQMMLESGITCLFAFIMALALVNLFRPLALHYFGISMNPLYQLSAGWVGFLIGLFVFITLLSGAYAAFYLSSFQPDKVLKTAGFQSGKKAALFRKGLVVAQFTISIAIIITTFLIARQMRFVRTHQLNGRTDQVMVIQNKSSAFSKHFKSFKNDLKAYSSIASVSAGIIPTQGSSAFAYTDSSGNTTKINVFGVKYNYFKTLGLKLISGMPFDPERAADSNAVILTKTYANELGYKTAKGQIMMRPRGKLIGIVQDFHSETLFEPEKPVMIKLMDSRMQRLGTVLIRLKHGRITDGIKQVKQVWHKYEPKFPLNFSFLDQIFAREYRTQNRLAKIFNVFAAFSILIACLGLFGLASFAAERRTKEIGIRKVLGASEASIVKLLSKDFLKLVAIGFLIAVPIGWYAMHRWLQNFAYKVSLSWWIFLLAGGIALIIALATVSWQSVRAALANPVDSLRQE